MGRTDAVAFTNQWAARARQLGAVVDFEAGWDTRGNGMAANYEGGLVHHTASPSSQVNPFPTRNVLINGRSDLAGPLCNVSAPWSTLDAPRLVVISARPANHAGASGGKSMGPLPVTGSFNARVFGLEIDYAGTSPMTNGQYRAALIFARAIADVLGRSTEYVRGHAETSITGKWDPGFALGKTMDMAAFRRDAANYSPTQLEEDMPLTDADVSKIMDWALVNRNGRTYSFGQWLVALDDAIGNTKAAVDAVGGRVSRLESNVTTSGAVAPLNVDAAAVATALAGNQDFLSALARAVNDDAATRLAS